MKTDPPSSPGTLPVLDRPATPSPCDGCHAGCCRAFAVPLTGPDILRIAAAQRLSFWDFVCRWEDGDGTIARGVAPHFYFDDEPATPFVIGLLHQPSDAFPGATRCRFLMEQPAAGDAPTVGVCGVYAERPVACRVFPTRWNSGRVEPLPVPEFGRSERVEAYRLCPRSWSAGDFDADEARHNLQTAEQEMQHLHLVASRWNSAPRPWKLFPEFLRLVYGEM